MLKKYYMSSFDRNGICVENMHSHYQGYLIAKEYKQAHFKILGSFCRFLWYLFTWFYQFLNGILHALTYMISYDPGLSKIVYLSLKISPKSISDVG